MELINKQKFYKQVLKFFLPIAVMSFIMKSSQSIISAALARTVSPAIAMTAFSVSFSIASIIQAPCWALLKVGVAAARDQKSHRSIMTVGWWTFGIVMAIMLIVAFVPSVGHFVFITLTGLNPDILTEVLKSFRLMLFMPIMSVFRTLASGFVTLKKQTYKLTIAVILRIIYMLVIISIIARGQWLVGGIMGAFVFVSGFWVESLVTLWSSKGFKKSLPQESEKSMNVNNVLIFFFPIIAAQLIGSFINPAINAGLARVNQPELAISSFFVARSFSIIILGLGFRIHQIVVVFVKDDESWKLIRRFITIFSISTTLILLTIALTPLGKWIFVNFIGIELATLSPVLKSLAVLSIAPIFLFIAEAHQGILLQHKNTMAITTAKVCNIISLVLGLFVFSRMFPNSGAIIGSICLVFSYVVEAVIAIMLAKRSTNRVLKSQEQGVMPLREKLL